MIQTAFSTVLLFSTISFAQIGGMFFQPMPVVLSEHTFSLKNRQPDRFVNGVFKDNILLNLAYINNQVTKGQIDWDKVRKPFIYQFSLNKGESFAFHDTLLPEYQNKVVKTTNAHFNLGEGFKSDGYLIGDGVCHLASFIYMVAKDAGLDAKVPTNHDFAVIPDVPRQFGVAIFNSGIKGNSGDALQNLYITNNQDQTVTFEFEYNGESLKVSVVKAETNPVL